MKNLRLPPVRRVNPPIFPATSAFSLQSDLQAIGWPIKSQKQIDKATTHKSQNGILNACSSFDRLDNQQVSKITHDRFPTEGRSIGNRSSKSIVVYYGGQPKDQWLFMFHIAMMSKQSYQNNTKVN